MCAECLREKQARGTWGSLGGAQVNGARWWRWLAEAEQREAEARVRERRRTPKRARPRCGARCRDGHSCQAPAVWDRERGEIRNGRCRMHGGLSTGPRTEEGRRRSREGARKGGRVSAERRRGEGEAPLTEGLSFARGFARRRGEGEVGGGEGGGGVSGGGDCGGGRRHYKKSPLLY